MDVSKKFSMPYRLLHAVAAGHSWYGEWGYQFGSGSFGTTVEDYQKAVDALSTVPLSPFFSHTRAPRSRLQNTIAFYQSLSNRPLVTVRDLFCCVAELLRYALEQKPSEAKKKRFDMREEIMCRWPKEDVGRGFEAMVKVLRASDQSLWVGLRALKGTLSRSVDPPELLDFILKSLAGRLTDDGMVVAARCNAETNSIEYRLESAIGLHFYSPANKFSKLNCLVAFSQARGYYEGVIPCSKPFEAVGRTPYSRPQVLI